MFEDYLNELPNDRRRALQGVIDQVTVIAPEAIEGRSYGLVAFRYHDKPLLGFAATRDHLAIYPFSPAAIDAVREHLDGYDVSKGTIRFTVHRPLPSDVISELVRRRMAEIDAR